MNRKSGAPNRVRISKLLGFEIGPLPKDWHFWFEEPTDELFGQFWSMIADSERQEDSEPRASGLPMPGSWDQSEPDADFESEHDFGSDCESDSDEDVDHGHDPDFDLSESCLNHDTNASCNLATNRGLPVSLRTAVVLNAIQPPQIMFER